MIVRKGITQAVSSQAEAKYNLLDKKDRKILTVMGINPRVTYTELAKYVGISKNATKYRLDRLFEHKIIGSVLPVFNYLKLGYFTYDIFLKCNLAREKRKDFEEFLKKHDNIIWACEVFGSWDYYFELICKNPFELDRVMTEMIHLLGNSFQDYKTIIGTERIKIQPLVSELAEKVAYPEAKQRLELAPVQLDELDKKIIHLLCKDGRASYFEIGQKLNTSLQNVRNHIRKMLADTTIIDFMPFYGYRELGYTEYLILLKTRYLNHERETEFRKYLNDSKHIKLALHMANASEILLFACTTHPSVTENLIKEMKLQFPELVQNVELMHITNDLKLDFFPRGLF